jgi:hypothetical protein
VNNRPQGGGEAGARAGGRRRLLPLGHDRDDSEQSAPYQPVARTHFWAPLAVRHEPAELAAAAVAGAGRDGAVVAADPPLWAHALQSEEGGVVREATLIRGGGGRDEPLWG